MISLTEATAQLQSNADQLLATVYHDRESIADLDASLLAHLFTQFRNSPMTLGLLIDYAHPGALIQAICEIDLQMQAPILYQLSDSMRYTVFRRFPEGRRSQVLETLKLWQEMEALLEEDGVLPRIVRTSWALLPARYTEDCSSCGAQICPGQSARLADCEEHSVCEVCDRSILGRCLLCDESGSTGRT